MDRSFFFLVNSQFQNPFFDLMMPLITDIKHWKVPVICILWSYLLWQFIVPLKKGGTLDDGAENLGRTLKKIAVLLVTVGIGLGMGEALSAHVLKPLFGRVRPCGILDGVNLLASCNHSFSLPSGHAVNITALAVIMSHVYPVFAPIAASLAFLVCYSRVYVGVHYPFDVIAGAFVGYGVGKLAIYLMQGFLTGLREFRENR